MQLLLAEFGNNSQILTLNISDDQTRGKKCGAATLTNHVNNINIYLEY